MMRSDELGKEDNTDLDVDFVIENEVDKESTLETAAKT